MKKRTIALMMAVVMLFGATVGGTIAWLAANTTKVVNTFTVGSVTIDLLEAKVDLYGVEDTQAARVKANQYKLIPCHEYVKDPEVTVKAGSEPAWVFIKLDNGLKNIIDTTTIEDQILAKGWTALPGEAGVYYKKDIDARNGDVVLPVFDTFKVKADADVSAYTNAKIEIDAFAVQADGLTTPEAAFATLSGWGD